MPRPILTLANGEQRRETPCRRLFAYRLCGCWHLYARALDADGSPVIGGRDEHLGGGGSLADAEALAREVGGPFLRAGYPVQDYAGFKAVKSHALANGQTAAHVVLDGEPAGLDTYGGRWQSVCDLHSAICSHATLALAKSAIRSGCFCEACESERDRDGVAA